ncbi:MULTISPECIES: hypothetical protein [Gordonia]|jgi:hypothetical protein|uniref:Uncharacterized protein n=1 Tax=Gordonia malaquae NBRC 108250 TaxID=1223542 RepID=M3VAV3_GORML|nr:hypothetical protein [Gordonia malaquae]GAC79193.1 hypothetical protein GM1_007_01520 [Gordonia malaquae NBRC 108250]SEE05452.1 hypothetical protein SAMN04488550_3744 [Gordonia malaquae]
MDIISSITKVLAVGLILGAGLPALFALGMRAEAAGDGTLERPANPALKYLGYILIGLTAIVIVVGILWITRQTLNYYFDLKIFPDFAYKK